jgi:hypothetical protein
MQLGAGHSFRRGSSTEPSSFTAGTAELASVADAVEAVGPSTVAPPSATGPPRDPLPRLTGVAARAPIPPTVHGAHNPNVPDGVESETAWNAIDTAVLN